MIVTDAQVRFFGEADPFSNFNLSPMTVALAPGTRAVAFSCAEQLFMAWKAMHFADYGTLARIVAAPHDPKAHKAMGRDVTPFDEAAWHRVAPTYMYKSIIAKYEQNDGHRQALLAGESRRFVEASPYDDLWGVRMRADDPRIADPANWRGENRLGTLHDMALALFLDRERRRRAGEPPVNDPRDFFRREAFQVGTATPRPSP